MLGLHMVLNKFFIIDIWKGSEYASSSEYAIVTHGSVENGSPYSSGTQHAKARIYIQVMNMSRLHMVLCKLL